MLLVENRVLPSDVEKPSESVLERMLNRIRRTSEFPTVSKYLVEINRKLAANPETSNASDLAEVILKDYGLTNKLLKLVNSAFYGLAAGNVSTVTRAVVVLGYENVRLATVSLALFEHFKSKSAKASDLRETLIGSFWAGVLARDMAKQMGTVDPEEAFVCALMSQLGKLLMITFLPREYTAICDHMARNDHNEQQAAKAACGVTYEELGTAVAEQWNFPSQMRAGMQLLTDDRLENKKKPPAPLEVVCSFAKELGSIIAGDSAGADGPAMKGLMQRYRPHLGISKGGLKALVQDSLDKVQQHARALNIGIAGSKFLKRLSTVYQPAERAGRRGKASTGAVPADVATSTGNRNGTLVAGSPEEIIMTGIESISQVMTSARDIDEVAAMSLEVLYRALDFQRALMFIYDGPSRSMVARFGYGLDTRRLIGAIRFQTAMRNDLFTLSIDTGKDLIMADTRNPRNRSLIPQWYRARIDAPAFIFLPVKIWNACIGAFYADRHTDGQPITDIEHQHLGKLRDQLVLAIAHQQRSR